MYVVLWDDEDDKDFAQVCPDDELDLFLSELPNLYNDVKNIRIHILGERIGEMVTIYLRSGVEK